MGTEGFGTMRSWASQQHRILGVLLACFVYLGVSEPAATKTPLVKWAQRRNLVTPSIPYGRGEGRGTVKNEKVLFEPNGRVLVEWTSASAQQYKLDVILNGPIRVDRSRWTVNVKGFNLMIVKANDGIWGRLTKTTRKLPYITIDWDKWQDDDDMGEDDEEEEEIEEEEEL